MSTNKQAPLHLVGNLSQGDKVSNSALKTNSKGAPMLDAYGNVVDTYDAALASKTMDVPNKGIGKVRVV